MNESAPIKTLTVHELSAVIHRKVPSIKSDLSRKPESLPPRIVIPGSSKLVWLESDVLKWLENCRVTFKPQAVWRRR